MNAPFSIDPLALAILSGDLSAIPGDEPFYTTEEWQTAAQEAVDGDSTDLRLMVATERDYSAFVEWQRGGEYISDREAERREFADFGEWRKSRGEGQSFGWHHPDSPSFGSARA